MSTPDSEADLFAVFEDNADAEDVIMQSSCDTDSTRRSSLVRAFAHGAMGGRVDPSWWTD